MKADHIFYAAARVAVEVGLLPRITDPRVVPDVKLQLTEAMAELEAAPQSVREAAADRWPEPVRIGQRVAGSYLELAIEFGQLWLAGLEGAEYDSQRAGENGDVLSKLREWWSRDPSVLLDEPRLLEEGLKKELRALMAGPHTTARAAKLSTRRKPAENVSREPAIEARDCWLYEQCVKLVPYSTLIIRLRKQPKSWPRIETINGIKKAASNYAERHGLPPIPVRQRGRIRRA